MTDSVEIGGREFKAATVPPRGAFQRQYWTVPADTIEAFKRLGVNGLEIHMGAKHTFADDLNKLAKKQGLSNKVHFTSRNHRDVEGIKLCDVYAEKVG